MEFSANTAEQAVLSAIIKKPSLMKDVVLRLKPEDFGYPPHRSYFSAMLKCEKDGLLIDTASVINNVVEAENKDSQKVGDYLSKILSADNNDVNLPEWIKIIQKQSKRRQIKELAAQIDKATSDAGVDPDELQNQFNMKMAKIMEDMELKGPTSLTLATRSLLYRLNEMNGPNRDKYIGIPTGFNELDRMIGGLNRSDLILLGARPSMGKTAFGLNVAAHISVKLKKKVLFFSLEMSAEQLAQRFYACETQIPISKFRDGKLSNEEWRELNAAAVEYGMSPLIIDDDTNVNPAVMKAKIKQIGDVDVVIVDYLSLMKSGIKTENRVQEVSQITRDLKIMAKELEIPVLVLSQLNRSVESRQNASHKPQLSDLRESGSIEQDADIVMMLYRDEYYKKDDYEPFIKDGVELQVAEILVRKNRHGPCGNVKLVWIPAWTKFDNCPEELEKRVECREVKTDGE